jgi:hypothetical protein
MFTLENILLNEEDELVISFSYERGNVWFEGEIKTTKEQFIASHHDDDELLLDYINSVLQREFDFLVKIEVEKCGYSETV